MLNNQPIAALYCRLSKEDLDKGDKGCDSESIQNQKLLLIDYAMSQGFLVHNVYVDEDLFLKAQKLADTNSRSIRNQGVFPLIEYTSFRLIFRHPSS